jgi:hypothetical protein
MKLEGDPVGIYSPTVTDGSQGFNAAFAQAKWVNEGNGIVTNKAVEVLPAPFLDWINCQKTACGGFVRPARIYYDIRFVILKLR